MSDSPPSTAASKPLIMMCVPMPLGNVLGSQLTGLGNVRAVDTPMSWSPSEDPPDLVVMEVNEETDAAARWLLETSAFDKVVFIGPLRSPSMSGEGSAASDPARLTRAPAASGGGRDVRELSADVSVGEIVRVCRECLAGERRTAAVPPLPVIVTSPFHVFPRHDGAALPSLPAPLFPTSAPPSSHPGSQRPSSGAPPGPSSDDAEHESLFQLDSSLRSLLEEAEQRVATRVSPRYTSPPDPNHGPHALGFVLTPEVRAALEERVGVYESQRRSASQGPNSNWITRTGHGTARRHGGSEVSDVTRDGETSIPTSASHPSSMTTGAASDDGETNRPAALAPEPREGAAERATPRPPTFPHRTAPNAGDKPPTRPNREIPPPPRAPRAEHELPTPISSNTPSRPSSLKDTAPPKAPDRATADTTPPRRPTAAAQRPSAARDGGLSETDSPTTAELSSEPASAPPAAGTSNFAYRSPGLPTGAGPTLPTSAPISRSTFEPSNAQEEPALESGPVSGSTRGRRPSEVPPLREGDAIAVVARAIRTRYTGAIAVEAENSVRRIVMRDGDFITAASGIARESLLGFLIGQGTLAPGVAAQLGHKLPNFGRHAGAALIAAGHLTQEQMWPSLRAHAEHIITMVLQVKEGLAGFEDQVPERLAAEPAVFGGATGAEVFIELIRRIVSPQQALARLGGPTTILSPGTAHALLEECALSHREHELLEHQYDVPLSAHLNDLVEADLPSVLYALVQLRVLKRHVAALAEAKPEPEPALDAQAVRQLIANRKALVEEADYFELLGITPLATGHEVTRAYEALKRTFEPSAILTAATEDLIEDLELVHSVLDEAFDILGDSVRRARYRKAILSTPND